jgi:hypothetical protein
MSQLRTIWPVVALLAMFAVLLAACGGTPTAVSGPPPTPVAPTSTPSPEAEPSTPESSATPLPTETATEPPSTAGPAATATEPPSPTTPPTEPPSATPPPTSTPPPSTPTPAPQVLSFTANPTVTQNLGDVVRLAWEASGQRAELCPLIGTGPTGCQDVPLVGERDYVIDELALTYIGFALRVFTQETSTMKTVELHPQCQNLRPWFFADPPLRCPADEALASYAASQRFERGLMVWIEETDEFYVFYDEPDEQGFQVVERTVGLILKPGASEDNRVGEDPPPGLYEPVSGFGLIWRGEVEWPYPDNVRERLGWATVPESGFDTAYQCSTPTYPRLWNCFLLGPAGEVLHLRPDSTAGVRILWEEW